MTKEEIPSELLQILREINNGCVDYYEEEDLKVAANEILEIILKSQGNMG